MSLSAETPQPPQPPQWRPMPSPMPLPERRPSLPMIVTPLEDAAVDDVAAQLLDRRILLVTGRLDGETAELAAARLLLLDERSRDRVTMHLGCPTGALDAALTLIGVLDLVRAPVTAVAVGSVGGAAIGVFAAASERVAHPHASFLLHDPAVDPRDDMRDLAVAAEQWSRDLAMLHQRIAAACAKEAESIAADMHAGRLLTADDAVSYGLVQSVTSPR